MSFVLDCSVAVSWCFEDEANGLADRALHMLASQEALVPALWPLEVANVLLVSERRKRLTEADVMRFVELLRELPIVVDESTTSRAMRDVIALAREHDLSSYDASYLELAVREGLPLATLDKALAKVARRCGVALVE